MYKIIGANGSEYGPITAEQLRQWIAEGRVNAATLAQAEGETAWRPISTFSEFSAPPPQPSAPPPFGAPPSFSAPFNAIYSNLDPAAARAKALSEVNGPAIGLIATAIIGGIYSVFSMLFSASNAVNIQEALQRANIPNQEQILSVLQGASLPAEILQLAMAAFILYAALKMRKLESHTLCLIGCILAAVPCVSPFCCLGLPLGIWALVVLNRAEIKSQFK